MQWYRWIFLIMTLLGVYGLSYSPEINISNFGAGFAGTLMCAFGWGIEAVILAKSMQNSEITDEIALQIRQTTSSMIHGTIILPFMKGWGLTVSLFRETGWVILLIALAALFATISYLFYYKAIKQIGASKAMALNVSYAAWSMVFTVLLFRDFSVLNPITVSCGFVVLVCSILSVADKKVIMRH